MSIDYDKMQREFPVQKAALAHARKKGYEAVVSSTRQTVAQWDETGAWPDDWAHWQRTLDDAFNDANRDWIEHRRDTPPVYVSMDDL